jgi:hypothetical protein
MSDKSEETTAIVTLDGQTRIDTPVLGRFLQKEMNHLGFALDRMALLDDAGFRLSGPILRLVLYLDQGAPDSFLVSVYGNADAAEPKRLKRDRFRLCSAVVDSLLQAVTAERVAMYHNGVSYVTVRGQEMIVRRDRSARLRGRERIANDSTARSKTEKTRRRRRGFPVTSLSTATML